MAQGEKCKVCAEKKSNYFSIFEKVIGKDLPSVIENITGVKICPPNNILICQDCAVSAIQAETIVDKLRRSLAKISKKKVEQEKDIKTREVNNSKPQNADSIQSPIKDNGNSTTIWHFKCDHCSYESDNAKLFKKHLAKKHQIEKARIFKCNHCSESYQLLYRLESHIKCVHEDKTRPPPRRRNSTFPSEINKFTNEKEKDSESDKSSGKQQVGVKEEHNFDKQNKDNSTGDLHFKCDLCSYNSVNAKLFKRHLTNQHQIEKPRIFKCNQCSVSYLLLYGLQSHIKYVHEKMPRPPHRRNSVFPSEIKNSFSHEEDDFTSSIKFKNSEKQPQSLVEDIEEENAGLTTHQQNNNSDFESNDNQFNKNEEILDAKTKNSFESSNMVNSKGDWNFKCDQCPYETDNPKYFRKHLSNKHQIEKPRIFKCNQCSESYQLLYGLKYHIKHVHENKSTLFHKLKSDLPVEANTSSDYVSFKFPVSKKSKIYNSTISQNSPVKNIETNRESDTQKEKKVSIKRKKQMTTEYIEKEALKTDQQESTLPPSKKIKFTESSEQKTYVYRSNSESDNRNNPDLSTSLYECNDCSYNSSNAKHFKKHLMAKHQLDNSSIQSDNDTNHLNNIKSSDTKKQNTCVVCGKKFALIDELRLHMDNCHLGEVVRDCPHCGARFRSEQKYEAHVFSEKCLTAIYSCQYPNCNKRFTKSSKLRKHMQEKHPDEEILE